MTLGFLSGSKNFCKLLWVSCEVLFLQGYAWIHWVARPCTTTAYRWLFRDSQVSLRTLWSAVIKSPNFQHEVRPRQCVFCTGPLYFWSSGRSRNFGLSGNECEHCVYPNPHFSWMWALKILHERNWRVSLRVQELHHPPKFLWILGATPGFQSLHDLNRQTTGRSVPSWVPFYLVLDFWLAWVTTGFTVPSSTFELDTGTGGKSISLCSFPLSLDVAVVGEEDELEEDVERCLSCLEGVIEVEGWEPEEELWNHDRNEVLLVAGTPNPVFNEVWFLTTDSLIRISVLIAKLSERQYCWRVFEDFHSQEYVQLLDIRCSLFMGLHFSIGGFDHILVWCAIAFVNFTRWIGFCMSELSRKIDFGGFMFWKTQTNCRALDERRPVGPRFNSW